MTPKGQLSTYIEKVCEPDEAVYEFMGSASGGAGIDRPTKGTFGSPDLREHIRYMCERAVENSRLTPIQRFELSGTGEDLRTLLDDVAGDHGA